MYHPEEQPVTEVSAKRGSILMAFLLFLTIGVVSAMGYMKSQGIELKNIDIRQLIAGDSEIKKLNNTAKITEIPYDAKDHPVFGLHQDYIVKCTPDGVWFLDKNGRQQWSFGISLIHPVIKSNGRELLVADIGGRDVFVIKGKNIKWKDKTEEKIQNAEISEGGYVTVLTASKLYNGEITVYDNSGIEQFQSIIANAFAVTAKISPSGTLMATNLINASDAKAYTYLKFHDITGNELGKSNLPETNGIYPFIWVLNDNSILAAGDTSIIHVDKEGNVIWDKHLSRVVSACFSSGKRIAAAVKDGEAYRLKVFTAQGEEYSSVDLEGDVRSISSHGGVISVNYGMSCAFFTEKGSSKGVYNAGSEITNVLFFSKQQAAIITKGSIVIIDI